MFNIQRVNVKEENAKNDFFTSFQNTGFAVIENHDISFELIDDVYSEWEEFFNSEEKVNYKFDTNSQDVSSLLEVKVQKIIQSKI